MARRAEKRAGRVLKDLGIRNPPVDVEEVASRLDIETKRIELPNDCSATLVRQGDLAVIGVNRFHHPNRQRFSIAHEIGHHQLHKGGRYIDKSTSVQFRNHESGTGTKQEEIEANQFAAALLMPASWVRREFKKLVFDLGDDSALQALCEKFQVSSQAMTFRLVNLRLLDSSA